MEIDKLIRCASALIPVLTPDVQRRILYCYDNSHSEAEFIEMIRPTVEPLMAQINTALEHTDLTFEICANLLAQTCYLTYGRDGGTALIKRKQRQVKQTDAAMNALLAKFGLN